jgi:hypothetical protein
VIKPETSNNKEVELKLSTRQKIIYLQKTSDTFEEALDFSN